jgi:hypothetical protein
LPTAEISRVFLRTISTDTSQVSIGRFYLDLHPRAGKYSHAEMAPVLDGVAGKRLPEAILIWTTLVNSGDRRTITACEKAMLR